MRNALLAACVLWMLQACQNPAKPTVDASVAEKEITTVLENYHSDMTSASISSVVNHFTEDGLICGTDPTELWTKQAFSDYLSGAPAGHAVPRYPIEKRIIRVDAAALTATVLEQFKMDEISPRIPIRLITHLRNMNGKWLIDFQSWGMIPTNEDLLKINAIE